MVVAGATTRGSDIVGATAVDLNAGVIVDAVDVEVADGSIVATTAALLW